MPDEMDPGDALRELLAQRERAKKAVFAAALAREKAEEELAYREKLFQMQIEETQKLAFENARLRRAKEELDVRVKLVEDAAAVQALTLAKKDEQLERYMKLVTRVEEAIYEGFPSTVEQEIVEKAEEYAAPPVVVGDPHEGPHGHDGLERVMEKPERYDAYGGLFPFSIRTPIDYVKKPLVLVTAIALPFLVMTFFNALMLAGIKVQFVADLITPLWQPWMSDPTFPMVVGLIPVLLYASLFFFQRKSKLVIKTGDEEVEVSKESPLARIPETPEAPMPASDAVDADVEEDYLKQIDDIFGADDDA